MIGAVFVLVSVGLSLPLSSHQALASSISTDRNAISSLQARISSDGEKIQQIVIRYDKSLSREAYLSAQLAITTRQLASAEQTLAKARNNLRAAAVEAYVTGGAGESILALLNSSGTNSAQMSVYANVAAGSLSQAVTAYIVARHRIQLEQATLTSEHASAVANLQEIRRERVADDSALAADETLLTSYQGNLHHLLAVQQAEYAAEEHKQEQEMRQRQEAAAAAAAAATPPPAPSHPSSGSGGGKHSGGGGGGGDGGSSSGYADPLRGISALTPERIDQGVDYSGYGPIYAIGDGVVDNIYNGGWPGGTYIVYQLSSGPAQGLYVYAGEDISPSVSIGESVTSSTVLGTMYEGPDGIETGWADGSSGDTMAMAAGQFSGANSTAFGANFSQLLASVGAPPGVLQNNPPTGSLPSGWPSW